MLFVYLLEDWCLATTLRDATVVTAAGVARTRLRGRPPQKAFVEVPLELTAPPGHFQRNLAPFWCAVRTGGGAPGGGVAGEADSDQRNARGLVWRPTPGGPPSATRWRVTLTVRENPCYADECLPCT